MVPISLIKDDQLKVGFDPKEDGRAVGEEQWPQRQLDGKQPSLLHRESQDFGDQDGPVLWNTLLVAVPKPQISTQKGINS